MAYWFIDVVVVVVVFVVIRVESASDLTLSAERGSNGPTLPMLRIWKRKSRSAVRFKGEQRVFGMKIETQMQFMALKGSHI